MEINKPEISTAICKSAAEGEEAKSKLSSEIAEDRVLFKRPIETSEQVEVLKRFSQATQSIGSELTEVSFCSAARHSWANKARREESRYKSFNPADP